MGIDWALHPPVQPDPTLVWDPADWVEDGVRGKFQDHVDKARVDWAMRKIGLLARSAVLHLRSSEDGRQEMGQIDPRRFAWVDEELEREYTFNEEYGGAGGYDEEYDNYDDEDGDDDNDDGPGGGVQPDGSHNPDLGLDSDEDSRGLSSAQRRARGEFVGTNAKWDPLTREQRSSFRPPPSVHATTTADQLGTIGEVDSQATSTRTHTSTVDTSPPPSVVGSSHVDNSVGVDNTQAGADA